MAPLRIFRKKEKEAKKESKMPSQPKQRTLLEQLCGDDKELYEALIRTILLNPQRSAQDGVDPHIQQAQEYEKTGDYVKARISYQVAGEVSLYEGKPAQMQKFFKKAAEVDPNYENKKVFEYLSKKENAERAVAVAHEFYEKTGKRTETKEGSSG